MAVQVVDLTMEQIGYQVRQAMATFARRANITEVHPFCEDVTVYPWPRSVAPLVIEPGNVLTQATHVVVRLRVGNPEPVSNLADCWDAEVAVRCRDGVTVVLGSVIQSWGVIRSMLAERYAHLASLFCTAILVAAGDLPAIE